MRKEYPRREGVAVGQHPFGAEELRCRVLQRVPNFTRLPSDSSPDLKNFFVTQPRICGIEENTAF